MCVRGKREAEIMDSIMYKGPMAKGSTVPLSTWNTEEQVKSDLDNMGLVLVQGLTFHFCFKNILRTTVMGVHSVYGEAR